MKLAHLLEVGLGVLFWLIPRNWVALESEELVAAEN